MAVFEAHETRREGWTALQAACRRRFRLWMMERRRTRHRRLALQALMRIDDTILADIGIDRRDIAREAGQRVHILDPRAAARL